MGFLLPAVNTFLTPQGVKNQSPQRKSLEAMKQVSNFAKECAVKIFQEEENPTFTLPLSQLNEYKFFPEDKG